MVLSRKETQTSLQILPKLLLLGLRWLATSSLTPADSRRFSNLPWLSHEDLVYETGTFLYHFLERGHFLCLLQEEKNEAHEEDAVPVVLLDQLCQNAMCQAVLQGHRSATLGKLTGKLDLLLHNIDNCLLLLSHGLPTINKRPLPHQDHLTFPRQKTDTQIDLLLDSLGSLLPPKAFHDLHGMHMTHLYYLSLVTATRLSLQ